MINLCVFAAHSSSFLIWVWILSPFCAPFSMQKLWFTQQGSIFWGTPGTDGHTHINPSGQLSVIQDSFTSEGANKHIIRRVKRPRSQQSQQVMIFMLVNIFNQQTQPLSWRKRCAGPVLCRSRLVTWGLLDPHWKSLWKPYVENACSKRVMALTEVPMKHPSDHENKRGNLFSQSFTTNNNHWDDHLGW